MTRRRKMRGGVDRLTWKRKKKKPKPPPPRGPTYTTPPDYRPPEERESFFKKDKPKLKPPQPTSEKSSSIEKIANKITGAIEEVVDVISGEELERTSNKTTYEQRDVEQLTVSKRDLITVKVSGMVSIYPIDLFNIKNRSGSDSLKDLPSYCRLDYPPGQIPSNNVSRSLRSWGSEIRLEFNKDFIGKKPAERQGCALCVRRGSLPEGCEETASTNKLTITKKSTGDDLVFEIQYCVKRG